MPYKNPEDQKLRNRGYYYIHQHEIKAKTKAWREAHPEEAKVASKRWYEANRERVRQTQKRYFENHKAALLESRKRYYGLHREEIRAKNDEWRRTHLEQDKKRRKQYYEAHSEELKMAGLRHGWANMGVDVEEAERLWKITDNCQICGVVLKRGRMTTSKMLDHDHKTKRIRGILCRKCNSILGYANDSAEILLKASQYLESAMPVCRDGSPGIEQD